MKQIESTGETLTIDQREEDARRHIIHALARIEQQCFTLGHGRAAEYCKQAIAELKTKT